MTENLRKENQKIPKPGNQYTALIPRFAFTAFLTVTLLAVSVMPVSASTIFEVAKNAMQTVYKDVAGIATVAAVVCAAVCLLLMNFSKSGRTVDESRSWLKRIVVCWAALMTLGAIVTYFESIIPQSMFGGWYAGEKNTNCTVGKISGSGQEGFIRLLIYPVAF